MQKSWVKKFVFLGFLFAFLPLVEGWTQGRLACTATSTIVPNWGGHASVLSTPWNVFEPEGAPRNAYIHNDYIGDLYEGGLAFDFTGLQVEGHLDEPIVFDLTGRAGGKIRSGIVGQPNPFAQDPSNRIAFFFPPEGIIGGEGIGAELLPPDMGAELFDGSGNPVAPAFPATCPRLASTRFLLELDRVDRGINAQTMDDPRLLEQIDYYDAMLDPRSNPPGDVQQNNGGVWNFDCGNVLCINRVDTSFDWEDARLVIGTNDDGDVTEGLGGGMYANFHYTVVPCKQEYRGLYQTFLNGLAQRNPVEASRLMRCANNPDCGQLGAYQGMQSLLKIAKGENMGNLVPPLRAHGMLPGPFLSKMAARNSGYDQCEWLDTSHHAPRQILNYRNFCIWDWENHPPGEEQCAMILLWEGDGSSTDIARALRWVGREDITDDFIGIFEVRRNDFINPASIVSQNNYSGQLQLQFVTMPDAACRVPPN